MEIHLPLVVEARVNLNLKGPIHALLARHAYRRLVIKGADRVEGWWAYLKAACTDCVVHLVLVHLAWLDFIFAKVTTFVLLVLPYHFLVPLRMPHLRRWLRMPHLRRWLLLALMVISCAVFLVAIHSGAGPLCVLELFYTPLCQLVIYDQH